MGNQDKKMNEKKDMYQSYFIQFTTFTVFHMMLNPICTMKF